MTSFADLSMVVLVRIMDRPRPTSAVDSGCKGSNQTKHSNF